MREPRPRQRFPEGGLAIYEAQKAGTWTNKSKLLFTQPPNWISPRHGRSSKDPLTTDYILLYQPHFDPMLYFWPVEDCHLVIRTENLDSEHTLRLVRAAFRDGVEVVVPMISAALTSSWRFYDRKHGWKKPASEHEYTVQQPSKRTRYEMTLAAIRETECK